MTPFGHAAVTYLVGKPWKRLPLLALIIGGLLPDIDFLLLPLPFFNDIHRVITHNLFFLLLIAGMGALSARQNRLKIAACLLAGGLLHLFVDSILDDNPTNGIGVALFYPFSNTMFSPFNLAVPDPRAPGWNDLPAKLSHGWQLTLLSELPLVLAALGVWGMNKMRRRSL